MKNLNWTDAPGLIGLALIAGGIAHFIPAFAAIVIGGILVAYSYKFGK
jgi:hypothetical protein